MTREEAIDVLKHNYPSACFTDLCEAVEIAIQALSAQPQPRTGKWIVHLYKFGEERYECDNCHGRCDREYKFCPNCGADMRGEQDG